MIYVHINIVNIYMCVYRRIVNYLDKTVSDFFLAGDQGSHTARQAQRLSVLKKTPTFSHCG